MTAVALIIFNRPELTERVFAAIRAARPAMLLVVADGPRTGKKDEEKRCEATRAILDRIDWPCDVRRNYSDVNLGCGKRVSSGIDWVFQNVDRAIILEDDCEPNPSFFRYADELLKRYEHDDRIMHIGGANFQRGQQRGNASYFFSRYPHIWGWATWRRAWNHYDFEMKSLDRFMESGGLDSYFPDPLEREFWQSCFQSVKKGQIDTWDYQWVFACWANHALSIHPNKNLISNVGYGVDATHTPALSPIMNLPTADFGVLTHPEWMVPDEAADRFTFDYVFDGAAMRKAATWPARVRRNISAVKHRLLF